MRSLMRSLGRGLGRHLRNGRSTQARRSYVTETQRRRASPVANGIGNGLTYPLIDHHYEYVDMKIDMWELHD